MAEGRTAGLQTIFAIFLGLMVAAFVGVGVYTFHPSPQPALNQQIQEIRRQEEAIRTSRAPAELTQADRTQLQELARRRNGLEDSATAAWQRWARSTSIIVIAFATLAMVVSLVRADQLPVISNGLLLGGVFTMVYGVGWIIVTDTSVSRFVVMTIAFLITLGLGYARFVRRRVVAPGAGPSGGVPADGLVELDARLRDLEERMNEAAEALSRKSGPVPRR